MKTNHLDPNYSPDSQLTPRQLLLLGIIVQLAHEDKPITLKLLMARSGIRSLNGVNYHITTLQRKGFVNFQPKKAATLRPLCQIGLFAPRITKPDQHGELSS